MTEMYKILLGKYDTVVTTRVTMEHSYITRGNDFRLEKIDQNTTCAFTFFTNRVVNIWNSLPNWVVLCDTVNNPLGNLNSGRSPGERSSLEATKKRS